MVQDDFLHLEPHQTQ